MNLLDLGCFSPDFWDIAPRKNTRNEGGISVVKLGFLLNRKTHSLWFKMFSCDLDKL